VTEALCADLLTRDVAAADHLVQDCTARALEKIGLWEQGTDLRAWMFTILYHLQISHPRRDARQRPNTSKPAAAHKIYPYLLRGLAIKRVNQVWCSDVTYIPMAKGFVYLVVIMDWVSRAVLAWRVSNTLGADFCVEALEGGINFFDTANRYSLATSEEILGRAIKDFTRRDEVVIATKVYGRMRPGPNGGGLSRKAIMREIDDSLRRLGTDYVDLYQIHRWDYGTPIEETLEALHDVVKAAKARYIGASSMPAWQFARALGSSERHGWTRFVSMQNLVNLLYREEEREMLPLCAAEGIGVIPWSPQAREG
jgi:transposase InsO family protein